MKYIKLSQGKRAMVDDEDFEELNKYKWHSATNNGITFYAKRNQRINGESTLIRMHRVVLKSPMNMDIDHIDGNGLNNQKYNLRIATRAENCKNRKINKNNTSGYKGVSLMKDCKINKWRSRIYVDGKKYELGVYKTSLEAHLAYVKASKKYHGKFGRIK